MRRCVLLSALLAVALPLSAFAAGTIKEVKLGEGTDSVNDVRSPVYDSTGLAPIRIADLTAQYDRAAPITRNAGGGMFSFGPTYNLDPKIDLAALLTLSLRDQAPRFGLPLGDGGWTIDGALESVSIESRQGTSWGPVQYHCHMLLAVEVKAPDGTASSRTLRIHSYHQVFVPMVGSRKGSAETAIARMLVEGAQELLARLNKAYFHAAAHVGIGKQIASLQGKWTDAQEAALHRIGLSGSLEAVPVLTDILARDKDEDHRSPVINALARIADSGVVGLLSSRYAAEDEDCRWYTLKTFDYLGTDEALTFVREKGVKDADVFCKVLAEDIVGTK